MATVIKKVIVAIVSNPKILKKVLGIILGIILVLIMPIVAILSVFNGNIDIDTDRLQTMVVENLSTEEKAKLQAVENTMNSIESEMTDAGYAAKAKEAQVLYVLALYDCSEQENFISNLVSCFTADQTDEQLVAKVNEKFSKDIKAEDFINMMSSVRRTVIDTSGYTDITTKNNKDLTEWAIQAEKAKWGYVFGTYGTVLDKSTLAYKVGQYPDEVGGNEEYIKAHWLGGRTADCVGLIKGYSWYNADTHSVEYAANGMPDIGADDMYRNATEKGTIDTIPEIPGLAVWHEGHIGIYIGGGEVVEAMGTQYGVVKTQLAGRNWTHWLKVPYITYKESE